ncbi:MAG: hypothetical protein AAF063_17550 [Cyanobacteria bacterium J06643_5]
MAQRITITIADELYKRLQKVKSGLNISGLCQEAIDTAVQIEELKTKGESMEALIERLRVEKKEDSQKWRIEGLEAGKVDALKLSYQEFRQIEQTKEIDGYLLENLKISRLNWFSDVDEDIYLEGWVEGVLNVWENVQNEL